MIQHFTVQSNWKYYFIDHTFFHPSLVVIDMKMLKGERKTAQYYKTLNVKVKELLDGMASHVSS